MLYLDSLGLAYRVWVLGGVAVGSTACEDTSSAREGIVVMGQPHFSFSFCFSFQFPFLFQFVISELSSDLRLNSVLILCSE